MAKRSTARNREQTLNRIYEECIALASEVGLDHLRAEEVSKRCGISRPLLNHYFPSDLKAGLRQFLIERVMSDFKNYIDQSLQRVSNPEHILKAYVQSHFQWGREYPAHISVVFSFFPQCVNDSELRKSNTESVQNGLRRIETLLHYRVEKTNRIPVIARSFQIFLTGAIISYFTEDHSGEKRSDPEKLVLDYLDFLIAQ